MGSQRVSTRERCVARPERSRAVDYPRAYIGSANEARWIIRHFSSWVLWTKSACTVQAGRYASLVQLRRARSLSSHNAYPLANTTTKPVQSGRKATAAPAATALNRKSARASKTHVQRRPVDWRCIKRLIPHERLANRDKATRAGRSDTHPAWARKRQPTRFGWKASPQGRAP